VGITTPHAFDLISRYEDLPTAEAVWSVFQTFYARYGFAYGALVDLPGPTGNIRESTLFQTWPREWAALYNTRNYVRMDPSVHHLRKSAEPFTWVDVRACPDYSQRQLRIFGEIAEFGMKEGYVIPIVGLRNATAVITLGGEEWGISNSDRAEVHLAGLYAQARIRALASRPIRARIPVLSDRERECLQWAAAGKTDWEIGEILSISEKTANAHIERAKRKYEVTTRIQAVVMAFQAGDIYV
jgi:LuxR family quorum sensing-dependent transcriptional regulator